MFLYLVAALAAIFILRHLRSSWSFPPGPTRVPILGSVSVLTKPFGSRFLLDIDVKQYGNIIGYFFGPRM